MDRGVYFATACWLLAGSVALTAPPARAAPEQPRDPVVDMFFQPLRDVRLEQAAIPPKLLAVLPAPYALDGLITCAAMAREIEQLDAVLPTDVGMAQPRRRMVDRMTEHGSAMIGGFIPFRGIVREISGAHAAERRFAHAIRVGEVRRAFLKGVGLARGCSPPAAPPQLLYVLAGL